jgi:transketolase
MAVGLALGERMQAARYPKVTSHHTYVIAGDGCLMEGVSHEAISLAGHLGLGRLTVLWDDNHITIDGPVAQSSSDDQLARFAAAGWHTASVADGEDMAAVDAALTSAKADPRPSLIAVRTIIGHGAKGLEGTAKVHGAPLGEEVLAATKRDAGWNHPDFTVPAQVAARALELAQAGAAAHRDWNDTFDQWAVAHADDASTWHRTQSRQLPANLDELLACVPTGNSAATRVSSRNVLGTLVAQLPELVGGSADLAESTGTHTGQALVTRDDYAGATIHFGIREFGMAALMNGLSLHGGFRPYGSTFLVFSDYLRPALRLSALMRQPVIYVLTHDSVALGEDGPTHQPVEHVEALRQIPGVTVLRPADDVETVAAWHTALANTEGPTVLVLTRQNVPTLGAASSTFITATGSRVVRETAHADVQILASGSEVAIALDAAELLALTGVETQVVSVPWREKYVEFHEASAPLTVSVEAGVTGGWAALAGLRVGVDKFGASGKAVDVLAHFGLTADAVAATITAALRERKGK